MVRRDERDAATCRAIGEEIDAAGLVGDEVVYDADDEERLIAREAGWDRGIEQLAYDVGLASKIAFGLGAQYEVALRARVAYEGDPPFWISLTALTPVVESDLFALSLSLEMKKLTRRYQGIDTISGVDTYALESKYLG